MKKYSPSTKEVIKALLKDWPEAENSDISKHVAKVQKRKKVISISPRLIDRIRAKLGIASPFSGKSKKLYRIVLVRPVKSEAEAKITITVVNELIRSMNLNLQVVRLAEPRCLEIREYTK